MSERQPYENQLNREWHGMSLPDENRAWEDMQQRLDKERKDRGIIVWRNGCMLLGFALLIAIGLGWWIFEPHNWFSNDEETAKTEIIKPPGPGDSIIDRSGQSTINSENAPGNGTITQKDLAGKADSINNPTIDRQVINVTDNDKTNDIDGKQRPTIRSGVPESPVNTSQQDQQSRIKDKSNSFSKEKRNNPSTGINNPNLYSPVADNIDSVSNDKVADSRIPDTKSLPSQIKDSIKTELSPGNKLLDNKIPKPVIGPDTAMKSQQDSSARLIVSTDVSSDPNVLEPNDSVSFRDKKTIIAAGIALQQQVPLDGQKAVPYNSLGRKGTIGDYVPSFYLQLHRKGKWLLQAEFKYGAPQYAKGGGITYSSKTYIDSTTQAVRTANTAVGKTYYHELPVSFQLYVTKNWMAGAGVVWNRFSSAVTRQLTTASFGSQVDSTISDMVVQVRNDSVFAKSYFQALVETQYQWRRIAIGARYAFGLQPYIKFRLAGGAQQEEKNSSLQLFFRYQLWKSKEKVSRKF